MRRTARTAHSPSTTSQRVAVAEVAAAREGEGDEAEAVWAVKGEEDGAVVEEGDAEAMP